MNVETNVENNSTENLAQTNEPMSIQDMFLGLDEPEAIVEDSEENNLEDTQEVDVDQETEETEEEVVEDVEEESDTETEQDTEEVEPESPSFTDETDIELSDGTILSLGEVKQGYLRHSDYSRKTQEVSVLRKDLESKAELFVPQATKFIKQIEDAVAKDGGWNAIRASDPVKAEQLTNMYVEAQSKMKEINETFDTIKRNRDEEAATKLQESKLTAVKELQMAIPNLSQQVLVDMADYATSNGFNPDEVDQIADSKTWLLIHKAMLHDKAKTHVKQAKQSNLQAKKGKAPIAAPKSNVVISNNNNNTINNIKNAKTRGERDTAIRSAFMDI